MNKKLLTVAVAAALAAPAAMAGDVTIYGQAHIATSSYDGEIDTADAWDISSHASRIGFKGTEGLGNGLTAVWQMELGIDMSDNDQNPLGEAAVGFRNTFIGLTGGWGTAVIGRHDTPYKISSGSLDIFGDTIADYNGNGPGGADGQPNGAGNVSPVVAFMAPTANAAGVVPPLLNVQGLGFVDLRVDQAIAYISPSMNGLTIAAAIVQPGLHRATTAAGNEYDADGFSEAYSIAALYGNGPFFASIAYEVLSEDLVEEVLGSHGVTVFTNNTAAAASITNLSDALDKDERWRLGFGYTANGMHVGFVYEDQDHPVDGVDAKRWQLSGSYTFGNNVVKAMYGENEIDGLGLDMDQWAIGLDHNFSKRTKAYAVYTDFDSDGNGLDWDGFSLGMVHKF